MEKTEKKKQIADRLALARKNAGLSQGQTAKLLSMHRPTISEIEAARRNVSVEELTKFAEIYGVDFEWLGCANTKKTDQNRDRLELAARELSKLKKDDLDKVIDLLSALRGKKTANERGAEAPRQRGIS